MYNGFAQANNNLVRVACRRVDMLDLLAELPNVESQAGAPPMDQQS